MYSVEIPKASPPSPPPIGLFDHVSIVENLNPQDLATWNASSTYLLIVQR